MFDLFGYLFVNITHIFRQVALLYYKLAADAGIEVGDFNLAYLCDENKVNTCLKKYFNLLAFS